MSDERINSITASNYSITAESSYYGSKIREWKITKFNGSCLKEDKITQTRGKIVNSYMVYEINKNYNISSYPTLGNCLFGTVSLTKNNDIANINILDMVLDLIKKQSFHLVMVWVEIVNFWNWYEFFCTCW